jgi:S1-C subfamily serine protease
MKRLLLSLLTVLTGCYIHSWPVTHAVAESSTYEIDGGGYQGTAWKVAPSYVITVGHMCEVDADVFTVETKLGRKVKADPVEYEMSLSSGADVCVLHLRHDLPGDPLVLADHLPNVGTKDGYVGFPKGKWFSGEGEVVTFNDEDGPSIGTTAPCNHGASGSAVFTKDGVYGVLVQGHTKDGVTWDACLVTPVDEIKSLLNDAGVGWAHPPEMPQEF